METPKYDEMFNPLIQALKELGGSASVAELEEKVAEIMQLPDDVLNEIHNGNRTKFSYNLAWTRTYLKGYGILENSSRGVWVLTSKGMATDSVIKEEVNHAVKTANRKSSQETLDEAEVEETVESWKDKLIAKMKELEPDEFERLCQRILREAGFTQVKVTGKSGDGGIDGTGLIKIAGFLSFRVIFQCKRYQGSVSSPQIREFKGTMVGRADKGLFITTGSFTRDAIEEANRDGSIPIDLVDGEDLAEKIKELGLGVRVTTKSVEEVEVIDTWFDSI